MQPRTRKQSRLVVTVNPRSTQRVSTLKLSRSHRPHALSYRGTYDNNKLQDALEYYFINNENTKQPSRHYVSTRYHIPNSTFCDWHDRLKLKIGELKTDDEKKQCIVHAIQATHSGPQRLLDVTTENDLVSWALNMQERGYPVSKLTICMKAMELHVYHNNNSDRSRPHHTRASQRWWVGFKTRHREIVLRTPHALEKERQKQTKQEIIDEYFDKLEKLYQKYKYEPHQIYAGDEVGIDGDGIDTKKVIARKGTSHVLLHMFVYARSRSFHFILF
jgi:hypothetical protein